MTGQSALWRAKDVVFSVSVYGGIVWLSLITVHDDMLGGGWGGSAVLTKLLVYRIYMPVIAFPSSLCETHNLETVILYILC